jgi:hypothetical protein
LLLDNSDVSASFPRLRHFGEAAAFCVGTAIKSGMTRTAVQAMLRRVTSRVC